MNIKRFLAASAALALVGCELSSTSQAGTSSETQSTLQALADNAGAITANLQASTAKKAAIAPRRMSSSEDDSLWALAELHVCAEDSASTYAPGRISVEWRTRGVGPDGSESSCSLKERFNQSREFSLDSLGRSDFLVSNHWMDTISIRTVDGTGISHLRSGLELRYIRLQAMISPNLATFSQLIELPGGCRIEVRIRDTLMDTGWCNSGVDAPVVCDSRTIGHFKWDQIGTPRIYDDRDSIVVPHPIQALRFPEDSMGLYASVIGLSTVPGDSMATLRLAFSWRFLEWDRFATPGMFHLCAFRRSGGMDVLDSIKATGRSLDSVSFRIPKSFAAEYNSFYVTALPLGHEIGSGFWATSKVFPVAESMAASAGAQIH